ncbi:MAG: hypothetical protein P8X86_03600 [Desulfofustis sp.]
MSLTLPVDNSLFSSGRRIAIDTAQKTNGVDELSPLLKRWGSVPPRTRAASAAVYK